jgi:hypothetical protein
MRRLGGVTIKSSSAVKGIGNIRRDRKINAAANGESSEESRGGGSIGGGYS